MKRDARNAPKSVTLGFEDDCITLPIDAILPLRRRSSTSRSWRSDSSAASSRETNIRA